MRFRYKALLFAAPLLLAVGYAEYVLRARGNSYTQKDSQLRAIADSITLLAFGDSEIEQGFDAAFATHLGDNRLRANAFCMAHPSQPIYYDSVLAVAYLPMLPKVRTLLVGYGPHRLMGDDNAGTRHHLYNALYVQPTTVDGWLRTHLSILQLSPREVLDFVRLRFAPLNPAARGSRFGADCTSPTQAIASARNAELEGYADSTRRAANLRRLAWLHAFCRARNVQMVLVMPPLSDAYLPLALPAIQRAKRDAARLGMPVVDLSAAVPGRYYQDADHLCQSGSRIFTGKLLAALATCDTCQ